MAYQSFEDLEVWNRAMDQAVEVFETFAHCRRYSLRDPMERAAVSVPSENKEISSMIQGLVRSIERA